MANIKTYKVGDLTITIDRSKCISCGTCSAIAPKTFELDKDLISVVKDQGPYDDEKTIREAAESCCVEAITIEKVS